MKSDIEKGLKLATICEKCGAEVNVLETVCPTCGFPLDPDPRIQKAEPKTVSSLHFGSTAEKQDLEATDGKGQTSKNKTVEVPQKNVTSTFEDTSKPIDSEQKTNTPKPETPVEQKDSSVPKIEPARIASDEIVDGKETLKDIKAIRDDTQTPPAEKPSESTPSESTDDKWAFVKTDKLENNLEQKDNRTPAFVDNDNNKNLEQINQDSRQDKIPSEQLADTSKKLEKVLGKVIAGTKSSMPAIEVPQTRENITPPPPKRGNSKAQLAKPKASPPPIPKHPPKPDTNPNVSKISQQKNSVVDDKEPAWTMGGENLPKTAKPVKSSKSAKPKLKKKPKPGPLPLFEQAKQKETITSQPQVYEQKETVEEIHVVAAGFSRRLLSGIIDQVIVFLLTTLFMAVAISVFGKENLPESSGVLNLPLNYPVVIKAYAIVYFSLFFAYTIILHSLSGQTIGKMLTRLRLVQMDGDRTSLARSLVRQILYFISLFLFGLGQLWVIIDSRKQSLHDKFAGTLVIRCLE